MFLLPRRRLVASRWREPFFLAWSMLVVGSIAFGVVLEDRPNTPLMFGFILPLIFSAISYPVVATAIVGSLVLASAAVAGVLTGQSAADLTFQLLALAFAALMGVLQAYGRERRAEQLSVEHARAQQYLDVAGTMIVVLDSDGRDRARQPPHAARCSATPRRSSSARTGSRSRSRTTPAPTRSRASSAGLAGIRAEPRRARERSSSPAPASAAAITWSGRTWDAVRTGMLIAGEDVTDAARRAGAREPHGLPRRAHRPGQPRQAGGARDARARPRPPPGPLGRGPLHRPRPLQARQRHARPRRGRRAAAPGRRAPRRAHPRDRPARPPRRRRVHAAARPTSTATPARRADRVAHDVLATLEQPFTLEGHEFEIAASIGIATYPDDGAEMPDVLKRADAALYDAKRDGRGTIRFAAGEQALRDRPAHARPRACAARSPATSSSCTTSRSTASRPARPSPSRRCCAGTTPSAGWSRPASSSPPPRTAG